QEPSHARHCHSSFHRAGESRAFRAGRVSRQPLPKRTAKTMTRLLSVKALMQCRCRERQAVRSTLAACRHMAGSAKLSLSIVEKDHRPEEQSSVWLSGRTAADAHMDQDQTVRA